MTAKGPPKQLRRQSRPANVKAQAQLSSPAQGLMITAQVQELAKAQAPALVLVEEVVPVVELVAAA